MKILVTGGAGYLGSVLVNKLIDQRHEVEVFDVCMIGAEGLLSLFSHNKFKFTHGDIRHTSLLKKVFKTKFDAVVHLAALVGEPACEHNPDLAWEINHGATITLAKLAKEAHIGRFIFMSSSSNYGVSKANELTDEDSPLNPLTLYAQTKARAEEDLKILNSSGFTLTIIRLAMLFGLSPQMRFNVLINEIVRDAVFGKDIVLYKENAWRPYTYTQDAADAIITILLSKPELVSGEIFNVGSENCRKKDLLIPLKKYVKNFNVVYKGGEADIRDYRVSFEKIKKVLHFTPSYTIEDGVKQLVFALRDGIFHNPYDENYSLWVKPEVFA